MYNGRTVKEGGMKQRERKLEGGQQNSKLEAYLRRLIQHCSDNVGTVELVTNTERTDYCTIV